jgi:hypothetical protein
MSRRTFFVNLEPRYTSGSPGVVKNDSALAKRVVEQERYAYQQALSGSNGEIEKKLAEEKGLSLIVFVMSESAKGWDVYDWITLEGWFWPHKSVCPTCKNKKVTCRRGYLHEHSYPFGRHDRISVDCKDRSFVGRKLEEWEKEKIKP